MTQTALIIGRALGVVVSLPLVFALTVATEAVRQSWTTMRTVWSGTLPAVPSKKEADKQRAKDRKKKARRKRRADYQKRMHGGWFARVREWLENLMPDVLTEEPPAVAAEQEDEKPEPPGRKVGAIVEE